MSNVTIRIPRAAHAACGFDKNYPEREKCQEYKKRLEEVLGNNSAMSRTVKAAGDVRTKALNAYHASNNIENFTKFAEALAEFSKLEAAMRYPSVCDRAAYNILIESDELNAALESALRIAKDKLGKRIAEMNDAHAAALEADGLDPIESPALLPLKNYYAALVEAVLSTSAWRENEAIRNSQTPWQLFSGLLAI